MVEIPVVNWLVLASAMNPFNYLTSLVSNSQQSTNALGYLAYNTTFVDLLGPNPTSELLATRDYKFSHEAGIYNQYTNKLYISSNFAAVDNPINVTVLDLETYEVVEERRYPGLTNPNGGCAYPSNANSSLLLFCAQGSPIEASTLTLVDPLTNTSSLLLTSYLGRNFSSINDVKIHLPTGAIFFTDAPYGYFQDFRPRPVMPNQIYRMDPLNGQIKVIADQEVVNNGLEFSPDYKTLYVADTAATAVQTIDLSQPATIYAYDVVDNGLVLSNRRVFAYVDNGYPDGVHTDVDGNVYAGCGDGVQVWNPSGQLLGKILTGNVGVPNFAFTPEGMVILGDNTLYLARIGVVGRSVAEQRLGRPVGT